MKSVFFVRDGLSVRREDNGDVLLMVEAAGQVDPIKIRVPVNELASAIAFLTPAGDTAETFGAMLRFLNTGRFEVVVRTGVAGQQNPFLSGHDVAGEEPPGG